MGITEWLEGSQRMEETLCGTIKELGESPHDPERAWESQNGLKDHKEWRKHCVEQ
jgi:hypothetical protein